MIVMALADKADKTGALPPQGNTNVLVVFWHKKGDILFGLGDSGQW